MAGSLTCVLTYHDVRPQPVNGYERFTLTPGRLREQLEAVLAAGFRPVTLHEVEHRGPRAGSAFAVTVDDGFDSFASYVLPVLQELSIPSTLFVPTGLVGSHPTWLGDGADRLRLLDWTELAELVRQGVDVAPHSVLHRHLDALPYTDCLDELTRSRVELESHLGIRSPRMAYPFGHHNLWVRRAARAAGFTAAYAVDDLPIVGTTAMRALPRVSPSQHVTGEALLQHVAERASRTSRPYYKGRRLASRVRRLRHVPVKNLTQSWSR
jgi:peptidoglycan/xylan/chitin deacetylase (PgdA/CDA1 family)